MNLLFFYENIGMVKLYFLLLKWAVMMYMYNYSYVRCYIWYYIIVNFLNIDIYFEHMVDQIYPTEQQLNEANSSNT